MSCERCGKREGEIRYTEYIDGEAKRLLICRVCADELGFGDAEEQPAAAAPPSGGMLGVATIEELLKGAAAAAEPEARRCPTCGSTASDLDDNSLFGCPACYEAFESSLESLFRRVHGRIRHQGRVPGGTVDAEDDAEGGEDPGESP